MWVFHLRHDNPDIYTLSSLDAQRSKLSLNADGMTYLMIWAILRKWLRYFRCFRFAQIACIRMGSKYYVSHIVC